MMNSRREISTRLTNDICLVVNGNTQVTECMYVCKSLFKHGKSSVKLKLKAKTNYDCFT